MSAKLKEIERKIAEISEVMNETAYGNIAYLNNCPNGSESDHKAYTAAFSEYQKLQAEKCAEIDKMAAANTARVSSNSARTFVNSYGEATERYITSTTYARAMRAQERRIALLLGRI